MFDELQMGYARCGYRPHEMEAVEVTHTVKKPLARAEKHGHQMNLHLVDQAGAEILSGGARSAGQRNIHPTCRSARQVERLFREYGLPERLRSDNGAPFATCAWGRLSQLRLWWLKLGILPELIEPAHPEQTGRHERLHKTLKAEATKLARATFGAQQRRFTIPPACRLHAG